MKLSSSLILIFLIAVGALAQRPRAVEPRIDESAKVAPPAAPQSVKAKYEGGVFGYRKKQDGFMVFDDPNNRLLFKDKTQKDVLFIPYAAVTQAFADTQSRRPGAASVVSSIPAPYGVTWPARFIKKKYQYLTMQFYDDESHVGGVTSFKLENKTLVESVVNTLANKAGLVVRGDIFVRDKAGVVQQSPVVSRQVSGAEVTGTVAGTTTVPVELGRPKPAVTVENEELSNRIISLPRPVYPEEAKAARSVGVVRVVVTVDERGRVSDAEVVSGPSMFHDAAVEAAKQAIFEPLIKNGQPVRTRTVIAYSFQET
jgi:TonB family protein